MKKIYTTLVAIFAIAQFSYAQWTGISGKIYPTTLTDYVGIGTTNPLTKFVVSNGGANGLEIGPTGYNGGTDILSYNRSSTTYTSVSMAVLDFRIQTGTSPATRFTIDNSGNVGIGTTSPDEKLTVKGKIHAEEVKIDLSVPAPDYVFESDYKLPALNNLKSYVNKNHHLPEIPSAKKMARDGLNLGEMNTLLLKKVEELTLYLIEKDQQVNSLQSEVTDLKAAIKGIKKALIKNKQ
jgi:hypothetical protein